MDEISELTESQYHIPLPIPDEGNLYRQVPYTELDSEYKRYPIPANFTIKFDRGERELSCNWDKHIMPEEIFCIIGVSYNNKGEFKDYSKYKIFKLPVSFVRSITGVENVLHTPFFSGNPAPIGKPNNYAHASIFYFETDKVEIRKKLATYCQENFNDSYQSIDVNSLESKIQELRKRGQDTKYHRSKYK